MLVVGITFIFKILCSLQGILPFLKKLISLIYIFATILVGRYYYFRFRGVETKAQRD